jgi:hypothetical protein
MKNGPYLQCSHVEPELGNALCCESCYSPKEQFKYGLKYWPFDVLGQLHIEADTQGFLILEVFKGMKIGSGIGYAFQVLSTHLDRSTMKRQVFQFRKEVLKTVS